MKLYYSPGACSLSPHIVAREAGLAPKAGTIERLRLQEWLNFISTELHKAMGTFFNPKAPEEWKAAVTERLGVRFDYLAKELAGKQYLMGDKFSVANAYLFTILNWAPMVK